MKILTALIISLCFSMICNVGWNQWEELPHDVTRLDMGGVFNKDSHSFSLTGVKGWEDIWVGVHASQIQADDKIHSQTLKAHAQGGYDFGIVEIQAFSNAERNVLAGIGLGTQAGGFLRKVVAVGDTMLMFSLGNYAENIKVDTETNTDSITLSRWYAGISTEKDFTEKISGYAKLRATPETRFGDIQGSLEGGLNLVVDDKVSIWMRTLIKYHDDSHTGDLFFTENSGGLSLSF